MIQELRGPWSALEDLGNALAKRAILQRSDQEEERKRAGDRVNQLMQLAQAGVLPEGALQAQSVQDLQQFGIAPSSVFAVDDMSKADRARRLENERRKTATDEKRTAAQIERDQAAAALDRARAQPQAPEPAKMPSPNDLDTTADAIVRGVLSQKGGKMADAYGLAGTNHLLSRLPDEQRKAVMDAARSRWLERRAAGAGGSSDDAQSRMDQALARAINYGREQVGPQGSMTDGQYRDAVVMSAYQMMGADPRFRWVLDANKKSPTLSTDLFVAYHNTKTTTNRTEDARPDKASSGGALAKALGGIGYKGAGAAPAATTPAPDAATPGPGHAKRKYGVTPSRP